MRFHSKTLVKFLSITIGATIGFLLYEAQNRASFTQIADRRYVKLQVDHPAAAEAHADQDVNIFQGGDHHHMDHLVAYDDHEGTNKDQRSFVTHVPKNSELTFREDQNFSFSSCPSSLQLKLLALPWSVQYYHPSVQMFMTSTLIDEDEYNRLETYFMPFGFHYNEEFSYQELKATLDLFSSKKDVFDFGDQPRPPCMSCAVVGNGGILNGSSMGQEIDQHDMVFRVNHCIRRGHEKDVGTRTTHYVFMDRSLIHTSAADIPSDKGMKWIFLPCRKNDYKYISDVARGNNPRQKLKAKAEDIRLLHPDFVRYTHKVWMQTKSFRPSTGAMMLMTALHAGCDRLSVYGMGFNKVYTEHYYDTQFMVYKNVKGSHDFAREIEIMKRLDQAGIIKWYKRDVPEFLS